VLIASTEDDYEDTVVPRLMAAGADLNFCHPIGLDAPDMKTLCREIERKVEALRDGRPIVRAVLIDPLSAFLGKVDGHNEGAVRVMLRPLLEAAMKHRFAVISLHHTRKSGSGGSAKDQVSGSKAFVAVARSAFLVARDREDDTKHLVLFLKGNLVPDAKKTGLAYRIVGTDLTLLTRHGAVTTSVPRIQWLDEAVTVSANEAVESMRKRQPKLSEVRDWLTDILRDGPMPFNAIKGQALEAGYSMDTVNRAAEDLGIKKTKDGYQGPSRWAMSTKH
jgi:putative DNA primase/helicase